MKFCMKMYLDSRQLLEPYPIEFQDYTQRPRSRGFFTFLRFCVCAFCVFFCVVASHECMNVDNLYKPS